jgi:peptide deformylase
MVRPILRYGEPLLHDVAAPVAPDAVTAPSTRALIDDLLDTLQLELEGCLSLPGIEATVARPARVRVRHLDRDGRERTLVGDGLLARALQHEIDHLDGVLFIDRLPVIARRLLLRRLRQHRHREGW